MACFPYLRYSRVEFLYLQDIIKLSVVTYGNPPYCSSVGKSVRRSLVCWGDLLCCRRIVFAHLRAAWRHRRRRTAARRAGGWRRPQSVQSWPLPAAPWSLRVMILNPVHYKENVLEWERIFTIGSERLGPLINLWEWSFLYLNFKVQSNLFNIIENHQCHKFFTTNKSLDRIIQSILEIVYTFFWYF